jgi:hypothetical protein
MHRSPARRCPLLPHIARLGRSVGLKVSRGGCDGSARARVSARRRALGSRWRSAMGPDQVRRVSGGHPGRSDEQQAPRICAPRATMEIAAPNQDLATPITGMLNSAAHTREPGRPRGPDRRGCRPSAASACPDRPGPHAAAEAHVGRTRLAGRAAPSKRVRPPAGSDHRTGLFRSRGGSNGRAR